MRLSGIWPIALAAAITPGLSCADASGGGQFATFLSRSPAEIYLSHPVNVIAGGGVQASEARQTLRLGHPEREFAHIADVAELPDGRFAVLDRRERRVWIYDVTGSLVRSFGREGDGPGEFRNPLALTYADSVIVVWQGGSINAFTMFKEDGTLISTMPRLVEGDWDAHAFRSPHLDNDDFQQGPEDITRRLGAWPSGGFLHQLQPPERRGQEGTVPSHLIHYSLEAGVTDTTATLVAAVGRPDPTIPSYISAQRTIPLYSGRPLWASGDGWFATAQGDSPRIDIWTQGGEHAYAIRWRPASLPVTDDNRMEFAELAVEAALEEDAEFERMWRWLPPPIKRSHLRTYLERNTHWFADAFAEVAAVYGVGRCLFVAGYRADDYLDGTARTLLAVDVQARRVAGIVHVPRTSARIREIGEESIYVSDRNDQGVWQLERFAHGIACRGEFKSKDHI